MGEACNNALRVNFNRNLELEFNGTKFTYDAGKILKVLGIRGRF